MKKSLYLAVFLAWICAIAGGCLALANYVTAPIIEANKAQAEAAQFAAIFGDGVSYESVAVSEGSSIEKAFIAGDMGYAYKVNVNGYQSTISFLVGVAADGQFIGFEVLEIADTPGFGMKVKEDESYKQMILSSNINDGIDTISGATISSAAVSRGFEEIKAHFEANFK